MPMPSALGRCLPLQVNLGGTVYRDHSIVGHDSVRKIGLIDGCAATTGLSWMNRHCLAGAAREREYDPAAIDLLASAGHQPSLAKVHQPIDHHLRVNAKVAKASFSQQSAHCVRHSNSNSNLQASPIRNLGSNIAGESAINFKRGRVGDLWWSQTLRWNDIIHVRLVNAIFRAVDIREQRVNLNDDFSSALQHRRMISARPAEVVVTAAVPWATLDHGHIHGIEKASIQVGRFSKVHRDVVGQPFGMLAPIEAREVPVEPKESISDPICLQDSPRSERPGRANFYASQIVHSRGESAVKGIGLAHPKSMATRFRRADEAAASSAQSGAVMP